MRERASASRKLDFDETPSPHNQPYHSPAKSSNASPPPPTVDHVAKEMYAIYLPRFLELSTPKESQQHGASDVVDGRARQHLNNGVYQFTTTPRGVLGPRTVPHLTPSAH